MTNPMHTIDRLESEVRSYCRSFPAVFDYGEGSHLYTDSGDKYLDFLSGAGALNYGHNHPKLREPLIKYIEKGGITHGLDMATSAKAEFIERFDAIVLKPRGLDYKIQFPGPTGTNSVESALKLARKVTGRDKILSFTNAFHGMTLGSLSISGNNFKRDGAGVALTHTVCMPYDGYFGDETDTINYMDQLLSDGGSGIDLPAAAIVETIQAESGVNVAHFSWLRELERLCRKYEMLLIVDDIQVGCGRTGPFFSFEPVGIEPDLICLSKSISGYGLPMALTLIKPELDQWQPGEHNGTFRGHNLAFVTATEALSFWETAALEDKVKQKGQRVRDFFQGLKSRHPEVDLEIRGRGLIQGIDFPEAGTAEAVSRAAFHRGLVAETSGAESQVVKIMPPLTIDTTELDHGLEILEDAVLATVREPRKGSPVSEESLQVN